MAPKQAPRGTPRQKSERSQRHSRLENTAIPETTTSKKQPRHLPEFDARWTVSPASPSPPPPPSSSHYDLTSGEHPSDRLPQNTLAQDDVGPRTSAGSLSGRHAPHLQQLGSERETGHSADDSHPAAPEARATFLSPLEHSFALIEPNDFPRCGRFIADNPTIGRMDHRTFTREAIQAYSQDRKLFARSCVQRAVMIENFEDLTGQGIRDYLQDLIDNRPEASRDFWDQFDKSYSEVQRLASGGQQRHNVDRPNFGAKTPPANAPLTSQKNRSDYAPSHQIAGQRSTAAGDLGSEPQNRQHQRLYSKAGQTDDRPSFTQSKLPLMRETRRSHPMAAQNDPNSLLYAASPHTRQQRKHSMADQTGTKVDRSEYANVTPIDRQKSHAVAGVVVVEHNSSHFTDTAIRPSQRSHGMAGQTGSDPYSSRQDNLNARPDQNSYAMAGQGDRNFGLSLNTTLPMDAKRWPDLKYGESGEASPLPCKTPSIMRSTQRSHPMATEPAASMQGSTKTPEQVSANLAKMDICSVRPPSSNTLVYTSPEAASAKLGRASSQGSQPAAPAGRWRKNKYLTLEGKPAEIKATEGEEEQLDPRYKRQKAGGQFFIPGCVFAMLWHENATNSVKIAEDLGPAVHTIVYKGTKGRYGETIFSHIRRMIVIKKRHGYSWCIPINTYGHNGLTVKNFNKEDIQAHAIVYRNGAKVPKALAGEEEMKKDPIAVDMVEGHKLDPTSRVFISKVQSVDWNVKVMRIGRLTDKSLSFLDGWFRSILDER